MTTKADLYARFNLSHLRKKPGEHQFFERDVVLSTLKAALAEVLKDPVNQQSEAFNTPKDFDFLISEAMASTSPPPNKNDLYKDFANPFGLEQFSSFREQLERGKEHNPRRMVGIKILLKATDAAQEALWNRQTIGFPPKSDVWAR